MTPEMKERKINTDRFKTDHKVSNVTIRILPILLDLFMRCGVVEVPTKWLWKQLKDRRDTE